MFHTGTFAAEHLLADGARAVTNDGNVAKLGLKLLASHQGLRGLHFWVNFLSVFVLESRVVEMLVPLW